MAKKSKTKLISVCEVQHYRKIDEINPHPENPRTISRDRLDDLKDSIVKKGFYEPILVWGEKNYVLSGNHRLMAVKELIAEGWSLADDQLPVVPENCDKSMAMEILFETNNRYAEWIDERVRAALKDCSVIDATAMGFTPGELEMWISMAEEDAKEAMETLSDSQSAIDDYELPDEKVIDAKPRDKVTGADHSEQKALVLPQELYNKMMRLLKQFAAQNDPEWREGDNIVPILDSFCDYMLLEEEEDLDAP